METQEIDSIIMDIQQKTPKEFLDKYNNENLLNFRQEKIEGQYKVTFIIIRVGGVFIVVEYDRISNSYTIHTYPKKEAQDK